MANRSRKGWDKSWRGVYGSKAAPKPSPSIFRAESVPTTTPLVSSSGISCLSGCLDGFRDSIYPHHNDFAEICAIISSNALSSLHCCDVGCGMQISGQKTGQDSNVNEVVTRCRSYGIPLLDPGPPSYENCTPWASKILITISLASSESATVLMNSPTSSAPPLRQPTSAQSVQTNQEAETITSITDTVSLTAISTRISSVPTLALSASSAWEQPRQTSSASNIITIIPSTATSSVPSQLSPTRMRLPTFITSTAPRLASSTPPAPPFAEPTTQPHPSAPTLWQKLDTDAKVGLIFGLCLLFLALIIIALYLLTRRNRLRCPKLSPSPRMAEPKTSLDASGIRWPEKVILKGEAKEFYSWTREYEKENRLRRSLREGQYRILGGAEY